MQPRSTTWDSSRARPKPLVTGPGSSSVTKLTERNISIVVAEPGSYRPLAPSALYLARKEWQDAVAARPIHLASTFLLDPGDPGGRPQA